MKKKSHSALDAYLGKTVKIEIDRPMGSTHPQYPNMVYPVNYGYIPGTEGGDGEEVDVYLLGVDQPVQEYTAKVVAVVYRSDDVEEKLVAVPEGMHWHADMIRRAIHFQERYFHTHLKLDPARPTVTFYRGDPQAPKTTMPAKLGANAIITYDGKLLLERRRDSNTWGLVGGGVKKTESALQAMVREIREELGLCLSSKDLRKLAVYGEPGRIAAYRDGSIWRMVVVVFYLALKELPELKISEESTELRFFDREELEKIEIVVTHSDIISDWFINRQTEM